VPSATDPRTSPTAWPARPGPPSRGPAPAAGRLHVRRPPPPRTTPHRRPPRRAPPPPRRPPARGGVTASATATAPPPSPSGGTAPPWSTSAGPRHLPPPPPLRQPPALGARRWPRRPMPPAPRSWLGRAAPSSLASRVPRVGRTPPLTAGDGGRSAGGDVAPPGWGWCWEPPAGAGRAWPARGKQRGGRHGRHAPAGGAPAPTGQLSGARAPGPRTNGHQGVAGRGGYVARARRRVATPEAATSGGGARSRFPLVSTYRIGGLVLHCT